MNARGQRVYTEPQRPSRRHSRPTGRLSRRDSGVGACGSAEEQRDGRVGSGHCSAEWGVLPLLRGVELGIVPVGDWAGDESGARSKGPGVQVDRSRRGGEFERQRGFERDRSGGDCGAGWDAVDLLWVVSRQHTGDATRPKDRAGAAAEGVGSAGGDCARVRSVGHHLSRWVLLPFREPQ